MLRKIKKNWCNRVKALNRFKFLISQQEKQNKIINSNPFNRVAIRKCNNITWQILNLNAKSNRNYKILQKLRHD